MAVETEPVEQVTAPEERDRSTILFPYGDVDWAIKVAKGVYQVGGTSCQWDQLAAQLGMAANGGGFRTNLLTAKIFGLVTYGQGTVQLTPLGQKACDPAAEKVARAEAFLVVPLYKAVYDRYKGMVLPKAAALENEMATLGVAKKQTDKARQAFQRSAQQAGFFAFGPDRLVLPATGPTSPLNTPPPPPPPKDEHKPPFKGSSDDGTSGGRHPFIAGLIKELPAEGAEWITTDRAKWLQAAATIFDLLYKNNADESGKKIEISAK